MITGATALLLGGCDFIPGTDSYQESKARDAVTRNLVDPSSAQFRNVGVHGDLVCGEVNGKNRMGAYVGFQRFYVRTSNWDAILDPEFNLQDLNSARALCLSGASFDASSCNRQAEEEAKQISQSLFDATWAAQCAGHSGPASQLPFDPTRFNNEADTSGNSTQVSNDHIGSPPLDNDTTMYASPSDTPLVDADGNPFDSGGSEPPAPPRPTQTSNQLNQNWLDGTIGHSAPAPSSNDANPVKQ
jgi:hypothetical protein